MKASDHAGVNKSAGELVMTLGVAHLRAAEQIQSAMASN